MLFTPYPNGPVPGNIPPQGFYIIAPITRTMLKLAVGLGVVSGGQIAVAQPGQGSPVQPTEAHSPMSHPSPETTPPSGITPLGDRLLNTAWLLEDLGGTGVVDRAQSTLQFVEPGGIAGRGACNHYFGSITLEGDRLSIHSIGSTEMACAPAIMDQEARFLNALLGANRVEIAGAYLLIYFAGSDHPLKFTPMK